MKAASVPHPFQPVFLEKFRKSCDFLEWGQRHAGLGGATGHVPGAGPAICPGGPQKRDYILEGIRIRKLAKKKGAHFLKVF